MRRMNNKGIIRIIEAFIAILLILGAVAIVLSRLGSNDFESQNIIETEKIILNQIADNANLRNQALSMSDDSQATAEITTFIASRVPSRYEFEFKVCNFTNICPATNFHKTLYAHERAVSSNLTTYEPKKMKIYIWPKEE